MTLSAQLNRIRVQQAISKAFNNTEATIINGMQTYSSINEAFKNGSGDRFFTINGRYVALSRHLDNIEEMIERGFTFMQYEEVIIASSVLVATMDGNPEVQLRQNGDRWWMISNKTGMHTISSPELDTRVYAHWNQFQQNQN
jgi:hypothetical protein